MLCVACCDDDPIWLEQFARQLDRLLRSRGEVFQIRVFSSGVSLLDALADPSVPVDLLFLDILLEGSSGLELAAKLRVSRPQLPVVLVSISPEFALHSYSVHPAHYLLKPISDEALCDALEYCLSLRPSPEALVFRWKKVEKLLPLADILYVEVLDSQLKIHTCSSREYTTGGHLSQLERRLPAGRFLRCHKSYLVNLDHAEGIRRYSLLLSNGQTVPVSKQNYAAIKEAYLRHGGWKLT